MANKRQIERDESEMSRKAADKAGQTSRDMLRQPNALAPSPVRLFSAILRLSARHGKAAARLPAELPSDLWSSLPTYSGLPGITRDRTFRTRLAAYRRSLRARPLLQAACRTYPGNGCGLCR